MAELDLVVRNGTVVTGGGRRAVDVAIHAGRFAAIDERGAFDGRATYELDATGLFVLPGVIDSHVHFRSPGLEHEEDWLTGSRSAVMGGVTTVLDMPNTVPPTDTPDRAREKLALAATSAYCDFGIFGLVGEAESSVGLARSGLVVGMKAFMGPTTGSLGPPHDDAIRAVLATGMRVSFHAEDAGEIESAIQALPERDRNEALAHLMARPSEAEVLAIDHAGRLLVETGGAGHIAHVTSAEGLAAVERWRDRGANLTCEVTPHHLLLDSDVYDEFGGMTKVNPPIRGGSDAAALLAALADGTIDCVASDHAPHVEADKRRESIWDVPAGFAGVETLLPLMLTEVAAGRLTLERLVDATSAAPARAWGLRPQKGGIEIGSDADLTIVDLDADGVILAADLHGKNNHSPFEGRSTRGAAVATVIRGRIVARDRQLLEGAGSGRAVGRLPASPP